MLKNLLGLSIGIAMLSGTAMASQAILTPAELHNGMVGKAYTTTTGNKLTSFNVEIIGVVPSGKGAPAEILARAYGGIIPNTNGVIHGMSGSPVYVDGKLIGAIARGIGNDVLPYKFYITPITAMKDVLTYPDTMSKVNKIGVKEIVILPPDKQEAKDRKAKEDFAKTIGLALGKDVKDILPAEGTKNDMLKADTVNSENETTEKVDNLNKLQKKLLEIVKLVKNAVLGSQTVKEQQTEEKSNKAIEDSHTEQIGMKDGEKRAKCEKTNDQTLATGEEDAPIKVTEYNIAIATPLDLRDENRFNDESLLPSEHEEKCEDKTQVKSDTTDKLDGKEEEEATSEQKEEAVEQNSSAEASTENKSDESNATANDSKAEDKEQGSKATNGQASSIVSKQDESKPVKIITPEALEQELAKVRDNNKLAKMAIAASALKKWQFNKSLQQRNPLFTSNGELHGFVTGFSPQAKIFLRKLIKARGQAFANNGGLEIENGSDVDLNYPLKPGAPIGATVAYGDFSIGATGTVTAVDGDKVIAFGHPMFFKGNVNYFMNTAKVIDSAGGILDGVQVASIGKIIGRISQDRYAGIGGILNSYPASVPVRVKVIDIDRQKVMDYGVKIAYDESNLVPLTPAIVYGAISRTVDRELFGTAQINFSITNSVSPNGVFRRSNMYYDPVDVGENLVTELTDAIGDLVDNKEKVSNIYDVNVEVRISTKRRTATITSVTADKMDVRPGDVVTFNITLQPYRAGERIITVPYLIPKDQPKGPMTFEIKGGGFIRVSELMDDNNNLMMAKDGEDQEETTLDKLDKISDQGRNNDIIINPIVDVSNAEDLDKAVDAAFKLSQAMESMSPDERAAMLRSKEVIHKTKYVVDNVRHITLNVLKK